MVDKIQRRLPECVLVDELADSPNVDQRTPCSFKAQLRARWERRPALRRNYLASVTRSVDLSKAVVIFQMDIHTADTDIMEQIVRCALGGEHLRPAVGGIPQLQVTQFLVKFTDMLKASSFGQCLTVHRIK